VKFWPDNGLYIGNRKYENYLQLIETFIQQFASSETNDRKMPALIPIRSSPRLTVIIINICYAHSRFGIPEPLRPFYRD